MITKEIIQAYIQGDETSFDKIYQDYSPGMYFICLRYTRCQDDAKDVLQDSFIKVFKNRSQFDIEQPIGPWIKTITIRTALNYIKENYKLTLVDNESYFDASDEVDNSGEILNEMKQKLLMVLNGLPDGYRTVFNLYTIDNLTHKEIGEYLNISEGTSKSQYAKAKKMIKQLLASNKVAS